MAGISDRQNWQPWSVIYGKLYCGTHLKIMVALFREPVVGGVNPTQGESLLQ